MKLRQRNHEVPCGDWEGGAVADGGYVSGQEDSRRTKKGFKLSSMGRGFDEDPEFFLAAAAAGAVAGEMLRTHA